MIVTIRRSSRRRGAVGEAGAAGQAEAGERRVLLGALRARESGPGRHVHEIDTVGEATSV